MSEQKTVRNYLLRYKNASMNIESLTAEKERIEGTIYSITANMSGSGGGSGSSDKVGDGVSRLIDLRKQIDAEIIMYAKSREEIRRVIKRVWEVNAIYGQDLHYRYVDFRGAFSTANDMGFTTGYERRIHRKALECASRFM